MSRQGSILVLVLWSLFFLAALALAVGAHVSASVNAARALRERMECFYLAKAGVEYAIATVQSDTNLWDDSTDVWHASEPLFRDVKLGEGCFTVVPRLSGEEGDTSSEAGLVDEESKININRAGRALLQHMLHVIGGLDSVRADTVASAIEDWRDADTQALSGGEESGAYSGSAAGVKWHNGDFQVVEELLLVPGIGPELFSRIGPYVTVYGSGRVNVNTAEPPVLECVVAAQGGDRGVARSLSDKIVSYRRQGGAFRDRTAGVAAAGFTGDAALTAEESKVLDPLLRASTVQSSYYGGVSVGSLCRLPQEAEGVLSTERRDCVRIEFVYDKQRQRIVHWREE